MAATALPIDSSAVETLTQRLVQVPSISGSEGALAALVAEEMRASGWTVETDRMGNVIGRIGSKGGNRLLFDAHMDTVDVGDRGAWKRDPFAGAVERGVLYGRGAVDNKAALAAMIQAGSALLRSGVPLEGALYLAAVVLEEPCEGLAIGHVVEEKGIHPDWVVIGEPTNLHVSRGQRGRIELRITVKGRSAHAASPERGVNAIYGAARAIVGLELLAQQLSQDAFLGKGSIAVTEISSSSGSRNAVPDSCTLYVDRRLTVGETEARALAELRRALAREGVDVSVEVSEWAGESYTGMAASYRQVCPYWLTAPDAPLLVAAVHVIEETLGYMPHVGRWDFSTDGVYTAGVAGIPTIGFGPGEERFAHAADEQVRLADVVAATRVYTQLALSLLSAGKWRAAS
ncbi:MAG: YgeY family selenium metabolism-linked hydrolase [Chloroflexi bacterium]|nr:YgeY family selenium metabolism-linked hydrolase [Chloroflexota bacterium]